MSQPDETAPNAIEHPERQSFSALPKAEPHMALGEEPALRRRAPWMDVFEGLAGWLILLVLAAVGGALITIYWPWIAGGGADETAMADRVSALERQVGLLAAGKAPEAAAAGFSTLEHRLSELKTRLDADEARLAAAEKGETGATSGTLVALKAEADKNAGQIAQLIKETDRLSAIGAAPGKPGAVAPQLLQGLSAAERAIADNQRTLAGLQARLDALSKADDTALTQIRGQLAALGKTAPQLQQQLDSATQRIAALEKTAPPADLAQRLDSFALKSGVALLETRVTRIEKEDVPGMMKKAAAMLALADLIRASGRDTPYTDELAALRALVPAWPAMALLERHAAAGAPTVTQLAARFHGEADIIVAAERSAHAQNWAEKAWAAFYNTVSIRQIGNRPGNTTQARVARAEYDLDRNDLPAAIGEIEGLDRPASMAARGWLAEARARRDIDLADAKLTQRIVAAMAEEENRQSEQPAQPR